MIMKRRFLLVILLCWPFVSMAVDTSSIDNAATISEAADATQTALNNLNLSEPDKTNAQKQLDQAIKDAQCTPADESDKKGAGDKNKKSTDDRTDEEKKKALEEKQKAYDEAKANEQSLQNRTLTAVTTAATGIGGMELAMGLAQQSADKKADADMDAYIATFRCTYGNGKQVKGGPEEIELPGGNDQNMMNLRAQYIALAADLKERKAALDMTPGIESEEILDKSQMGLYDDENIGVTGGAYASLYRAKALESEEDQAKIDEEKDASKKRVIAGGVLVGAGTVIGVGGNMLLNNDEIKEKIKELKEKRDEKKEEKALEKLKACLKEGGAKNTESLSFSTFKPSVLNLNKIDCKGDDWKNAVGEEDAATLFVDNDDETSYAQSYSNFLYGEDDNKQTNIADILFKNIKK